MYNVFHFAVEMTAICSQNCIILLDAGLYDLHPFLYVV